MLIGLLQCGATAAPLDRVHGGYPELYAGLLGAGFEWRTWRVFEGAFPASVDAADGWLISGSRHGAYEDHPWIAPLEALIRSIQAARRPLVGICFGHQIVAQALGGRVEKFAGGWAVGRRAYAVAGQARHLNAWHQDQVTELPPMARLIASNDFTRYAGFAMGDSTLTLQPHPEFSPAYIADMIPSLGRGTVPDAMLDHAQVATALPVDNDAVGAWLGQFLVSKRMPA